jgi:uncharacterized protein
MKQSAPHEVQPELFSHEPLTDVMWESLDSIMLAIDNDDSFIAAKLDGYIAGVLCCPVKLKTSEWFPLIWGSGQTAESLGEMRMEIVVRLVMQHYNHVKSCLEAADTYYVPRFEVDDFGEPMWDVWAEGFYEAIDVGHRGWNKISEKNLRSDLAEESFMMLMGLLDLAHGGDLVPEEDREAMLETAPTLIPVLTKAIYELNTRGKITLPAASEDDFEKLIAKVGRNDPCPCGSGKKFKKCHGG